MFLFLLITLIYCGRPEQPKIPKQIGKIGGWGGLYDCNDYYRFGNTYHRFIKNGEDIIEGCRKDFNSKNTLSILGGVAIKN